MKLVLLFPGQGAQYVGMGADLHAQYPAALTDIIPLLESKHEAIRKGAAQTLIWVSRPESLEVARHALQHADPQVKHRAALALHVEDHESAARMLEGQGFVLFREGDFG